MGNARTWAKWTKWTGVVPGHLSTLAPVGERPDARQRPPGTQSTCKLRLYRTHSRPWTARRDPGVYKPVYILTARGFEQDQGPSPDYLPLPSSPTGGRSRPSGPRRPGRYAGVSARLDDLSLSPPGHHPSRQPTYSAWPRREVVSDGFKVPGFNWQKLGQIYPRDVHPAIGCQRRGKPAFAYRATGHSSKGTKELSIPSTHRR
jgi:hypothetical protein